MSGACTPGSASVRWCRAQLTCARQSRRDYGGRSGATAPLAIACAPPRTARHAAPDFSSPGPCSPHLAVIHRHERPRRGEGRCGREVESATRQSPSCASCRGGSGCGEGRAPRAQLQWRPLALLEGPALCALVAEAHAQELRVLAHAPTALVSSPPRLWGRRLRPRVARCARAGAHRSRQSRRGDRLPDAVRVGGPTVGPGPPGRAHELRPLRPLPTTPASTSPAMRLRPHRAATSCATLHDGRATTHGRRSSGHTNARNTRSLAEAGVRWRSAPMAPSASTLGLPYRRAAAALTLGLPALEVLRIASAGGARLLSLQDAIGLVRVGYRPTSSASKASPTKTSTTSMRSAGCYRRRSPASGRGGVVEQAALLARLAVAWLLTDRGAAQESAPPL